MNNVVRATVGAIALASLFGLSACAEAGPEPLEKEYKVGDVMLEAALAESRHNVLELCNTGEGASEMRNDWERYGFLERSGMEWNEAIKYVADFQYIDTTAIRDYGPFTYPTIESLAETCGEAAFLAAQVASDIYYPETAAPLLEEFRTEDGSNNVIPLERIFNTIQASK